MKRFVSIIFAIFTLTALISAADLQWNSEPYSPFQYRLSDNTYSSNAGLHRSMQISSTPILKQHSFGSGSYTMPHAQLSQVGATQPYNITEEINLQQRRIILPSEPYRTPITDKAEDLLILTLFLIVYQAAGRHKNKSHNLRRTA